MNHTELSYKLPPYKHQADGIDKGLELLEKYGYVAYFWEMATGKTKTNIHVSEILFKNKKIDTFFIICPKTLISTWIREIEIHCTTEAKIFVWESTKVKTHKFQREFVDFTLYQGYKISIMNIEAFSVINNDTVAGLKMIYGQKCYTIIDESSKIKTHDSNRTRNAIKYNSPARYKAILTGTEITNSILDIYTQFEFLKSGFFGFKNWYGFRARYAEMKEIPLNQGKTVKIVVGFKMINEITAKVEPHSLRCLKKDCYDLPEKIFQTLFVTLNPEQKRVYTELKQEMYTEYKGQELSSTHKIALYTRFRQITGGFFPGTDQQIGHNNPKIELLLDDVSEYNGKVLIWAAFKEDIRGLEKALKKEYGPESTVTYYGENPNREEDENRFRDDPVCRFMIVNPQTGAFGKNWQFCTMNYIYSRILSPEYNIQLLDRSHRPGVKENCIYKSIVAENTIDERIEAVILKKDDFRQRFQNGTIDDVFKMI